jgi:hypothetical protein
MIMVLTGLLLALWIAVAWREHLIRLDAVGNAR